MAVAYAKVIELVGSSTESREKTAGAAVDLTAKSLRDLRIAEDVELDVSLNNRKAEACRAKKVSLKYEGRA